MNDLEMTTATVVDTTDTPLSEAKLSQLRPYKNRWWALFALSLAVTVDVITGSALFIVATQAARDLGLEGADATWILAAYSATFGSCLLSAGRLADLLPPGWIFNIGIALISVISIGISFVDNKVAFLVLRALQGVMAAATMPAAYKITVQVFTDKDEQTRALSILGFSGAVANSCGLVIGGCFALASWRWLFRFIAILGGLTTVLSLLLLPRPPFVVPAPRILLKRLDPVGVLLSTGAIMLLIVALTSGPTYGWGNVRFYVTLPVAVLMGAGFFLYESRVEEEVAMLPRGVWGYTNFKVLVFSSISPMLFWATAQFAFSRWWQAQLGYSGIKTAVTLVPTGAMGLIIGIATQVYPKALSRRQPLVVGGILFGAVGELLFIFSEGGAGVNYYKFILTGFIIGSGGMNFAFLGLNLAIVQTIPSSLTGMSGAILQVTYQLGSNLGLAVQAAFLQTKDSSVDIGTWKGVQNGMWFNLAWLMGTVLVAGAVFWKNRGIVPPDEERERVVKGMEMGEMDHVKDPV